MCVNLGLTLRPSREAGLHFWSPAVCWQSLCPWKPACQPPTSKHIHLRLLPFSAPLAHWQTPHPPDPGSTSWASPGGAGVRGKCRGSVTAESGRSESGGGSPPGWGQGPQTTPWAEPTAEGSEGLGVLGHQSQLLPELPGVTHRPRSGGPHLSASISSRTAAGNPGNRCGLEKGLARWSSG